MRRYLLTTGIATFIMMVAPASGGSTPATMDETLESAALAVQHVTAAATIRDEVLMVLIGSGLIGLAAVLRRTDFD